MKNNRDVRFYGPRALILAAMILSAVGCGKPAPLDSKEKEEFITFYENYVKSSRTSTEQASAQAAQVVTPAAAKQILDLGQFGIQLESYSSLASTQPDPAITRLHNAIRAGECKAEERYEAPSADGLRQVILVELSGEKCPATLKSRNAFDLKDLKGKKAEIELSMNYQSNSDEFRQWSEVQKLEQSMKLDLELDRPIEETQRPGQSLNMVRAKYTGKGSAESDRFGNGELSWEVSMLTHDHPQQADKRYLHEINIRIEVRLKQLTGILTIESNDIDETGRGTAVAKLNDEPLTQEEFNRMVAVAGKLPVQDLGGRQRRP